MKTNVKEELVPTQSSIELVTKNDNQSSKKPVDTETSVNEFDKDFNWDQEDPWLGVDVETGYVKMSKPQPKLNAPHNEAFYLMYKSRNIENPKVLVCMVGGPGICVMSKTFGRFNPLLINEEEKCLEHNPASITDDYHIIYIECPVGSGFSIAYKENMVLDYATLGLNAVELFEDVFRKNPYLAKADFFFNGESFCGLSLPQTVQALRRDLKISLKGVVLECHVCNLVEQQCSGKYQLAQLEQYKLWNNGCHKCCCHFCVGYAACCYSMGCIGFGLMEVAYYLPWMCPGGSWMSSRPAKCRLSDEVKDTEFVKNGLTNLTKQDPNDDTKMRTEDACKGISLAVETLVTTKKFAEMIGAKKSVTTCGGGAATIDIIDHDLKTNSNDIQAGWITEGISFLINTGEGDYIVPWKSVYDQLEKHWTFAGKKEFLQQEWELHEQKLEDPTFYQSKKVGSFEWRRIAGSGHLIFDDFPEFHGRYIREFMDQHY